MSGKHMIIALIFLLTISATPVSANEKLYHQDLQEIHALEDELLSSVFEVLNDNETIDSTQMPDKIDDYAFTRVFVAEDKDLYLSYSPNFIQDLLSFSPYVWVAEYEIGDCNIQFDLSRSGADRRWCVPAVYIDVPYSYSKSAEELSALYDTEEVYFVGGIPFIRYPVALVISADGPLLVSLGNTLDSFSQLGLSGEQTASYTSFPLDEVASAIQKTLLENQAQEAAYEDGEVFTGTVGGVTAPPDHISASTILICMIVPSLLVFLLIAAVRKYKQHSD